MKKLTRNTLCTLLALSLGAAACGCAAPAQETPETTQPAVEAAETPAPAQQTAAKFAAGTYQGTAAGNSGDITVSVTLTDDAISEISIDDIHDTYYLVDYVETILPGRIVERQSLAVDGVSGATMTSSGVLRAVEDALKNAGADVEALRVPVETVREAREETYDAVVVGAGGAGLTAALRLQEKGANVLLLEQLDVVGGTMLFSGGTYLMATDEATAQAYKDVIMGSLYVEGFPVAEGAPDIERIEKNIDNTIEVSKMLQDMGVQLETYYGTDYIFNGALPEKYRDYVEKMKLVEPDGYFSMGSWTVWQFENAYLTHGGKLLTGTKATELLQDETGKITGLKAVSDDAEYTIHTENVILCTGGYTHNEKLIAENLPNSVGDYFCTTIGADGSGIEMALAAGGVMTKDNYVNGVEKVAYVTDAYKTVNGTYKWSDINVNYAMVVGRDGERVTNESHSDYARFYEYADGLNQYWGIYNTAMLEEMGQLDFFEAEAEKCGNAGPYYAADTLEALGEACGFDAGTFAASVEAFNEFCRTGVETFQSGNSGAHLGGGDTVGQAKSETKISLEAGKYYAVRITEVGFDVIGGVKTGKEGQVLREDGSAIDGLYAAGFTSSRDFQGSGAASHYCNGLAVASGFTAAEDVLARLEK